MDRRRKGRWEEASKDGRREGKKGTEGVKVKNINITFIFENHSGMT